MFEKVSIVIIFILLILILLQYTEVKNTSKMKKRKLLNYRDYEPKTGDLILFSGRSFSPLPTKSFVIKFLTNSDISHIGIIWVDPSTKIPWIWETGPVYRNWKSVYPKIDNVTHYSHIVTLEETLNDTRQQFIVRPINKEIDPYKFWNYIEKHLGSPYAWDLALNWYEAYFEYLPLRFLYEKRECGYWSCGELVASSLQKMDVIDRSTKRNYYFPTEFTQKRDKIWYKNNYSFGKEFLLLN